MNIVLLKGILRYAFIFFGIMTLIEAIISPGNGITAHNPILSFVGILLFSSAYHLIRNRKSLTEDIGSH
jgi:hypothetical protein